MQMLVSDEAGSAVCACPRAPPNPTIPTRLFPPSPSPSPQPRVFRLRRPPRLRSTEGQPSHSLTVGAGIRHAVLRPAPSSGCPRSQASPEGAVRSAESQPQPGRPCSSLVVTSAGGRPVSGTCRRPSTGRSAAAGHRRPETAAREDRPGARRTSSRLALSFRHRGPGCARGKLCPAKSSALLAKP